MSDQTNKEPIRIPGEHWVEFHDVAINLTGIPDNQFRSVDEDGNPLVETESMDHPLLEFHDVAINLTGIPDEAFRPLRDDWEDDTPLISIDREQPDQPSPPPSRHDPKSV